MMLATEINPRSGFVALSIVILFIAGLIYSYLNPKLKMHVRWLGQWKPISGFGFAGTLSALTILAVVVAGNAWRIELISKRSLFLMGTAFAIGFAGWLYDRLAQQ